MKLASDGRNCLSPIVLPPVVTSKTNATGGEPIVSDHVEPVTKPAASGDQQVGKIAGIVVGILSAFVIIAALVSGFSSCLFILCFFNICYILSTCLDDAISYLLTDWFLCVSISNEKEHQVFELR